MNNYPWMQWIVSDWLHDTALCSPATKGVWADARSLMHAQGMTGEMRGTMEQLARACRCSLQEFEPALRELESLHVADVKREADDAGNVIVTLIDRNMQREFKEREATRLRVKRHRGNGVCNGDVTQDVTGGSGDGNSPVTGKSQSQSQNHKGEHARARGTTGPGKEGDGDPNSPPVSEGKTALSATEIILRQGELKRVESELEGLKTRADNYGLTPEQKLRRADLRERKVELLDILGMKA